MTEPPGSPGAPGFTAPPKTSPGTPSNVPGVVPVPIATGQKTGGTGPGVSQTMLRGREFESNSELENAWRAYAEGGHLDDALRILLSLRRLVDAADLIVAWVTRRPRPLADNDRAWAVRAAQLFEQGDAPVRAVEVLAWIGAHTEGQAIARKLADAGRLVDAGACYARLGAGPHAIEALIKLPRTDAQYTRACVEAARALSRAVRRSRWISIDSSPTSFAKVPTTTRKPKRSTPSPARSRARGSPRTPSSAWCASSRAASESKSI